MRDYLSLGPVPCDEDCAQVGSELYPKWSSKEGAAFIHQLERQFPGCRFRGKCFPHDFGSYHDVVVMFDDDESDEVEKAFEAEHNTPQKWDAEARAELGPEYFAAISKSNPNNRFTVGAVLDHKHESKQNWE